MRTTTVPARQIEPGLVAEWHEILEARRDLASPFFRPEYTLIVAASRPGVFVTVARKGTEVVGIFPFERRSLMPVGGPVGGEFADYHGLIAPQGSPWRLGDAVRASGLGVWRFANLLDPDDREHRWRSGSDTSWIIDLSGGFDAYERWAGARSRQYKRLARKASRLEEEVGPLRFAFGHPDPALVDHVIQAKRQQYASTGVPDPLAARWAQDLMRRLHRTDTPRFAGVLATLHAGDRLVAADLGVRSGDVFHSWLPVMDRRLRHHSPGHVLLRLTCEAASGAGLRAVDLGWGDSYYKERFANVTAPVHSGAARAPSLMGTTWGVGSTTAAWVRESPLHRPARMLKRVATIGAQGAR